MQQLFVHHNQVALSFAERVSEALVSLFGEEEIVRVRDAWSRMDEGTFHEKKLGEHPLMVTLVLC